MKKEPNIIKFRQEIYSRVQDFVIFNKEYFSSDDLEPLRRAMRYLNVGVKE